MSTKLIIVSIVSELNTRMIVAGAVGIDITGITEKHKKMS